MINGKKYSWEDISMFLAAHLSWSFDDVSWDQSKKKEAVYGVGSKPIGYVNGDWEASGKVNMLLEEYKQMITYAKGITSGIFGFKPFNIVVNYANDEEMPHTDTLLQCSFTKIGRKFNRNGKQMVELEFLIFGDIKEGDVTNTLVSASGEL
ncbi:MAG: hypothetical protein JXB50_02230 [Spirochaetes bacterium]|nr:hypothetical protein [Spirochaetota bacterium]